MCGIAGQVALRGDVFVDVAEVFRICRRLIHRGPDDEGAFVDPQHRAMLAMRRLSIIDLASGGQPVFDEDRSIVCVFNGEIYNFQELRRALERRGYAFRSKGDAEVIVHLYRDEGIRALERLRGMFAIAIWDMRDESLVLARDPIGEKPLYYCEAGGRLSFASEIEPLYRVSGLSRDIDHQAIDDYISLSYVPAPRTPLQSVRKVRAGEALIVKRGRIETRRFWAPNVRRWAGRSVDELATIVRQKLDESVQLRMVSDVPIGCFLSGGLDSSAVLSAMARVSAEPVQTFAIGFSETEYDELHYARMVARHFNTRHHELTVRPDAVAVIPEIVRHFGEPFGDSSAVAVWYVAQLARPRVTVALSGDGGDEVFAGYPWYRTTLWLNRAAALHVSPFLSPARWFRGRTADRLRRLSGRLGLGRAERFASLRLSMTEASREALYSPRFRTAVASEGFDLLSQHYAAWEGAELSRMQYTDIVTYLPEDLLVKVDRMTMAHSLESRSPLLDPDLVELGLALPQAAKISGNTGKVLLRSIMRTRLPEEILTRRKMGFTLPIAQWLRTELREMCVRHITGGALLDRGWFQPSEVTRLLNEHVSGRANRSTELWNLLMLAKWAERYLR